MRYRVLLRIWEREDAVDVGCESGLDGAVLRAEHDARELTIWHINREWVNHRVTLDLERELDLWKWQFDGRERLYISPNMGVYYEVVRDNEKVA